MKCPDGILIDDCFLRIVDEDNVIIYEFKLIDTIAVFVSGGVMVKDTITQVTFSNANIVAMGYVDGAQFINDIESYRITCGQGIYPTTMTAYQPFTFMVANNTNGNIPDSKYVRIKNIGGAVGYIDGVSLAVGSEFELPFVNYIKSSNALVQAYYTINYDATGTIFEITYLWS
jgi:hypothetical protein